MTILTTGACQFIVNSSGLMIPAAVGSVIGTVSTGVKLWVQSEPVTVALATAIGTGTSASAIVGAVVGQTFASAAAGALVGGLSASALSTVVAGSIAATAGGVASSPMGLLVVGTSHDGNEATYDCWKPVVRDTSEQPSDGMLLKDLVSHPNVANISVDTGSCLPQIVLENVWKETFDIEFVLQDSGLTCHAKCM